MSFYRTYRPQTVDELDLESVRTFFERLLTSGNIAHAYVFTGPRGTGKTSAARILAKIINCEKNQSKVKGQLSKVLHEPCNKCLACTSIAAGTLVDLLEIDAASNRGIDDIRSLREKINLAPVSSAKKVYIIDEAHMLTIEAFNALLKTLEEPPPHAVFVLATTEAHKIPETIASRCVNVSFPKAGASEVIRSLERIVKGEKLRLPKGALEAVAAGVDGSFREGAKLLEQLQAMKSVKLEDVETLVGHSRTLSPQAFVHNIAEKNLQGAVGELERLETHGVQWRVFLTELTELLRVHLLTLVGVSGSQAHPGEKPLTLNYDQTLKLLDLIHEAAVMLKDTLVARLPLEIVAVRWCAGETTEERFQNTGETGGQVDEGEKTPPIARTHNGESIQEASTTPKSLEHPAATEESPLPITRSKTIAVALDKIQKGWLEVLKLIRPQNYSVEGLLRSARPTEVVGDRVKVEVFYQFHLDQLRRDEFLGMVEEAIRNVFAKDLRVEYYLGSRQPKREVDVIENISSDVDQDIVAVAEEIFGKS